jgi:hypothetical protein
MHPSARGPQAPGTSCSESSPRPAGSRQGRSQARARHASHVRSRWLCIISLSGACQVLGPPSGDVQHPTLQMPSRLPPPAAAPQPASVTPTAAPEPRRLISGSAGATAAPVPDQTQLPDPTALSSQAWWIYPVAYDRGVLRVGEPALQCTTRPETTPRRMGRFAFELWLGRELVERLRFDFPLLAAETPRSGPRRPLREVPSFAPGAQVSVSLRIPASERATRARILDRATGESVEVAWPPQHDASASAANAPAPACPVAKTRKAGTTPGR